MHWNVSPYKGLEKVKYLFIDGGCLDSTLQTYSEKLFSGQTIEIDYRRLSSGYQKVFYYDCFPAQKKDEKDLDYQERVRPKIQLFNQLKSYDGFHVYEGTARYRDKRRGQEQKQVDIMIAVDMLTHSFRKNMHEATLLTSDLDFKPLIDALVQDGMYVSLWYQKGRTNYELIDAADSKRPLTHGTIKNWFTENFKKKIKIPNLGAITDENMFFDWQEIEKLNNPDCEIIFYQKFGQYAAVVSRKNEDESRFLKHDNLDQLKFYIDDVFSSNISR